MINKLWVMMIIALIFTILIELCFSFVLKVKHKKDFLNIVLVNIVTNPIATLIPYIVGLYYGLMFRWILLLFLELFAFLFEGYIYKMYLHYNKINSYLLSLLLNMSSYLIGEVINKIIY